MSRPTVGWRIAAAACVVATLVGCERTREVDTVLRGALVYDGTGSAGRRADVAIDAGIVVAIGSATGLTGRQDIDLAGYAISPGFVDIHSHADLVLLADENRDRLLEAKTRQGVTTIVVGNCGLGAAPTDTASAGILDAVNAWMTPQGVAAGPLAIADYLGRLESAGVPLNVATLVPHGPLRISAMGLQPGAPDETQAEAIETALRDSLEEGAFGLSVGLIYPPGMYSDTDELIGLAGIVAAADGVLTAHVRGSSETLAQATAELLTIARATNVRTHHSHFEAVGASFWGEIDTLLAVEDAARSEGLAISHDVFPYTRAATMMSAIFPPWSLSGGVSALLERLEDPETRERIRLELIRRTPEWPPWQPGGWPHNLVGAVGWDAIYVASVGPGGPAHYLGKTLLEIAADEGRDPFDVVADLMLSERGRVGQWVGEISGDAGLLAILAHPAAAVISDAEDYGRGVPHPAHAGAFARALRLNREHRLMPEGEMIRRMTAYPALIVGVPDVGRLAVGAVADLVVFDPATVADEADWDSPRSFASGIEGVMIGGRWSVYEGHYLPGSNGRVLRRRGTASRAGSLERVHAKQTNVLVNIALGRNRDVRDPKRVLAVLGPGPGEHVVDSDHALVLGVGIGIENHGLVRVA